MTRLSANWAAIAALAALLASALAACRDARPPPAGDEAGKSTRGARDDRSFASAEEALFLEKCGMCHRQKGMGTVILARRMDPAVAMLEQRDDLTIGFIVQGVRAGIGTMPPIQRGEVSDRQLTEIARYLARERP